MSTELDVEQLQSTKSEKLLALVLAVFLLIGGIWAYQEIDDKVRDAMPVRNPSAAEQQAIRTLDRAQQRRFRAEETVRRTRSELELAARGVWDGARRRGSGRRASRPVSSCRRRLRGSARSPGACDTAEAAARPVGNAAQERVSHDVEKRRDRQELVIFLLRTGAAACSSSLGYLLLTRLRDQGSRWFPLSASVVLFATVFAFVVAVDYLTDYFDPFDAGILLLSLIGVAATVVAFWLLQRYLARRLPLRRVRRRQCPYCGFPVDDNERCEGCGREVQGGVRPLRRAAADRRAVLRGLRAAGLLASR